MINKNNLFWKIIFIVKSWSDWSRENPSNFAKFVFTWTSITLISKYLISENFSNVPPVLNKLFMMAIISSVFSVIIFYIKFYYGQAILDRLKSILFPIIDFNRISSNMDKQAYLIQVARKENPNLSFWPLYCGLPLMILLSVLTDVSPEISTYYSFFLFCVFVVYTRHILKIRKAFMVANIPPEMILVPSVFAVKRIEFSHTVKSKVKLALRGRRGATTMGKVVQYTLSPEGQQQLKATATTAALFTGIIGGMYTFDRATTGVLGYNSITFVLLSTIVDGCYTFDPIAKDDFHSIRRVIPKDQLVTFLFPGTKKLDPKAVNDARLKLKEWEEGRDVLNPTPWPVLIGPHPLPSALPPVPAETKESSFEDPLNFE